ncbi:DUF1761 domain-containing protein [Paucihalobacter ruber]|uniref:DUF1761 domain-containing protein n=1 Tax=Paucihalobacter ruber TaxID=2567861 RepID=A0A506PJX1_9FLAO|nr:DUF1761 domain-containing protein [Paucihalobacter ruber]TPV33808.1 DUF1761 domain-containing protein [Paucihalobacter ruber]
MKTKNFLVSGAVAGIVYFLLGWLFYGILFKDFFPEQPEETTQTMLMIFLGCLTYGLFVAYIFTKWAQISTATTGLKGGAIIGLFTALFYNFFNMAMANGSTYEMFAMDTAITIVSTAIIGAVAGAINGKMG